MPMFPLCYYFEYYYFASSTSSSLRKPVVNFIPVILSFDLLSRHLNALINLKDLSVLSRRS